MLRSLAPIFIFAFLLSGCSGGLIERLGGEEEPTATPAPSISNENLSDQRATESVSSRSGAASINGYTLSESDIEQIAGLYGLYIDQGDYWYDPISGAWGFWGGPAVGFLQPYMELGYPPRDASGGGTEVVLNGRELHPQDLAALQQLLGPIFPGDYWLDASGNYGFAGGPAVGNLIYLAQGYGSNGSVSGGGGYYDSTYFGNIGSDGQSSYFYDSDTGCSVMSDGGVSC